MSRVVATAGSARGRLTLTLPARLRGGIYPLVVGSGDSLFLIR